MTRSPFSEVDDTQILAELDLSRFAPKGPKPVDYAAAAAAKAVGDQTGFRPGASATRVQSIVAVERSAPSEVPAQKRSKRVKMSELAPKPRTEDRVQYNALCPVALAHMLLGIEARTGAKRWQILAVAAEEIERLEREGTIATRVKATSYIGEVVE